MKPLFWLSILLLHIPLVAAQPLVPRFEPTPCPFALPDDLVEGDDVVCGQVIVREVHADPNSNLISIAVAVFQATSSTPQPDPIVYLAGGPGSDTLVTIPTFLYELLVKPMRRQRDVIIFDQRGIGFSQPSLNCPNVEATLYDLWEAPPDSTITADEQISGEMRACINQLQANGVVINAYNSAENAADVNDLRLALGYEQVNLYGLSYGTFLAQYVMQLYPNSVRSVILDSVLPVSVNFLESHPTYFARAFRMLFDACRASARCDNNYPDLETIFNTVVTRLNAEPLVLETIPNMITGARHTVVVDGSRLIELVYNNLYQAYTIAELPRLIYDLYQGEADALKNPLISYVAIPSLTTEAMSVAVNCADIAPDNQADAINNAINALESAVLRDYFATTTITNLVRSSDGCAQLGLAPAPDVRLSSDLPTLIIMGEFDPITPPLWGEALAQELPNSLYLEASGQAHGASFGNDCLQLIIKIFFNDPTLPPDTRCLTEQEIIFR